VDDLKRAVSLADPEIDNKQMEKYLLWAFETESEKLSEVDAVEQSKIIERLQNGNLHRAGRNA